MKPGQGNPDQLRRIRLVLVFFTVALVLSGLTAVPLEWEVNLLARNVEKSPGHTDSKTYTLDSATTVGSFGDGYRRHVFNTTVKLANVAGRRGI